MAFYEGRFSVDATTIVQPFTEDLVGFPPGSVHLTIEDQNVRYRYGPASPTTTDGHLFYAGTDPVFDKSPDIPNLKFIAETGTAVVNFTVKGR